MKRNASSGYTLIEVLTIVVVLVLLVTSLILTVDRVRAKSRNTCISNLKQMDGAIQAWCLENKKLGTSPVGTTDILDYLKGSMLPICPSGGTYSFTTVSAVPKCTQSAIGHSI